MHIYKSIFHFEIGSLILYLCNTVQRHRFITRSAYLQVDRIRFDKVLVHDMIVPGNPPQTVVEYFGKGRFMMKA